MLCPKCSFTTFEHAEVCKKCGYDLKAHRKSKGIKAYKPVIKRKTPPQPQKDAGDAISPKPKAKSPQQAESNTTTAVASLPSESLQTISATDTEKAQSSEASQAQPWLRFGARVIDYYLNTLNLFFIIGFFIGFAAPQAFEGLNLMLGNFFYSIIFGMVFMFIWVYIEAQLLCSWGTTPGRWVLGIVLRDSNGQKLSFSDALKRSFSVWLRGMGIGLPLISLVTVLESYNELTKKGITSWDQDGGFVVSHQRIGLFKIILAILLFILVAYTQISARLGGF